MDARDRSIALQGSFTNAVTILSAAGEFDELDFDESADAIKELADAIFERREASFKEFKIGSTGNARGSSGKTSSSKRSGGSKKRGSSRGGRDGKKKSSGPSSKQVEFYGDLMEALEDGDIDVSDYDNTAEGLTFDEAKVAIAELIELRDENDL